jgi:hypothetical protein
MGSDTHSGAASLFFASFFGAITTNLFKLHYQDATIKLLLEQGTAALD